MKTSEKMLLAIVGFIAICIVAVIAVSFGPAQASRHVTAKVVRIVPLPVAVRRPRDNVVAVTADGISSSASVRDDQLRCAVGDTVDGTKTGVSVVIDPTSCRRPDQTSSTKRP